MGLKYVGVANGPTALINAAIATGALVGFWIPNAGATSIGSGIQTVMTDVTGTSARIVQSTTAAPGNWLRDSADVPIAGWGRSINSQANRGNSNYMGFNGACAASRTALLFFKVQTPQSAGQSTMLGGTLGGVAAPEGANDVMAFWDDTKVMSSGDGGGVTANRVHSDYTGWVVVTFSIVPGVSVEANASKVGGTWQDIGRITSGNEIGYAAAWTGFTAWGAGDPGRETSNGIVKHAGVVYFSTTMSEAALQALLIAGHVITA